MADGLAWNYYYNYLKIVLPHLHGTVGKAVLPDYVAEETDMCNVIDFRKLLIIISEICSCYSGLIKADHIQKAGLLRIFYMTRAGVELKAYENYVYRAEAEGKPAIYVIIEFAIPLLAMNDMSKDSISSFSKEDQDVQVIDFYNKLKYTLNHADKDIRDCCVLMLISDIYSSCGRHLSDAIYKYYKNHSIML